MQVGTRVRVSSTAARRAGEEGVIVSLKRTAPVGSDWNDEIKSLPKNSAEIRFDDGRTPWTLFRLSTLERVDG